MIYWTDLPPLHRSILTVRRYQGHRLLGVLFSEVRDV